MKKILIIHHSGTIGGAGISLLHIIRSIDKEKFSVTVLCPNYPKDITNLLSHEKCEVIASNTSPKIFAHYNGGIKTALSLRTFKNLFDIIRDKKEIYRYIKEIDPDIVAVNSMTLFWIGKIAKKLNKKTICFHRETYQKGLFGLRTKIIKQGLSKWFDKVAFISKYDFKESGDVRAIKKVIYDRVDFNLFNNYSKSVARKILSFSEEKKYILYLGGMSELKGSIIIMDAMKYLKNENIKLVFLCSVKNIEKPQFSKLKSLKDKIKFLIKKDTKMKTLKILFNNGLENKVIFKELTPRPELYYKACDLIVFPSTKPHQSRPIYEAGISKIPILITDFDQTKEFAKDKFNVITFKKNDSKDLAEKIKMILQNKLDFNIIMNNNYKKTIENHNYETLKNDLDDLFS